MVPGADVYPSLSDWGGEPPSRRQAYAAVFTQAVKAEIGRGYRVVENKGPGVALIRITILGVEPPTGGASPGAVQFSLHVTDASSGVVLATLIRRRSPAMAAASTEAMVAQVGSEVGVAIRQAMNEAHRR